MSRRLVPVVVAAFVVAAMVVGHAPTTPAAAQNPHICENGIVITDPDGNAELVADCKILWGEKETIEGTGGNVRRSLNWSATGSLWSDDASGSEWEGVTVGGSPRRVTEFELDASDGSTRFRGNVPAAFGGLTGLVKLKLHWHYLGGSFSNGGIPAELGNLTNLVHLQISYTSVNGQIPSEIGKLTKLHTLDLGGNRLSGDIPPEIWGIEDSLTYPGLRELRTLRLHSNKNIDGGPGLTGTLPADIKNLTRLTTLNLHGNRFSGPIPTEITQLSDLTDLTLYLNEFTETIPQGLGSLPLETLDLRSNQLTGSVPPELEKLLPELQTLNLGGNAWEGCLPARLVEVPTNDLQYLLDYGGYVLCEASANLPPAISSATVDGAALTLAYSETLDATSTPDPSDYTVAVNGSTSEHAVDDVVIGGSSEHAVDDVVIGGSTVTLTLDPAVVAGDVVLLSYTRGSRPLQDPDSASAGELTDYPVLNNTTPDPPAFRSGAVDGDTLTLTYSEALDSDSGPAAATYTVTANSTVHTVSDVAVSGTTVTLTLSTPVLRGQTVRLSYSPPSTEFLQGLAGEGAAQLTNVLIANNTDVPPMVLSAEVNGDTLTLTYDERLDHTSEPAATAYTVTVGVPDRGVTDVDVSGSTVTLTLASAVVGGKTVVVSYDTPQTSPLTNVRGTPAGTLTNHAVDNVTNNDPVFTTAPDSFTVNENARAVGTVLADDVDIQDTVGYRLTPATPPDDGLLFGITNAGDLFFKLSTGADYEHPGSVERANVDRNVYWATVVATSGTGDRERTTTQQVTVTIINVEEPGELRFSSEQPEVRTALLATVKDPDGGVTVTTWTWEIADPSDPPAWTTLSSVTNRGSDSSAYSPVAADEGKHIRVTAEYTDAAGADQVQRTLTRVVRVAPDNNTAPTFESSETGQRSVEEGTGPGEPIGTPVRATDAATDPLTYKLGGTDADSFDIVPSSAQLLTVAPLDYETTDSYEVTVTATDPSAETATITVTITVIDVEPEDWLNPTDNNGGGGGGGVTPIVGGGFVGGGGGSSGPTPSDEDFGWNVTGDIDPLDPAHGDATGLWGDGTTLWVGQNGDGASDGVFAYDLTSHKRVADLEFDLAEKNRAPRGVWSDHETMWVSDSGQDRVFAYDLESGERLEDREFALAARNRDARGIWSDGELMWVLDDSRRMIFTYQLESGQPAGDHALDSSNSEPHGIWSDGFAIWVSDGTERRIFAYVQQGQGLTRVTDEEIPGLSRAGNNSPRGIWSDGVLMYVVDAHDDRIYTYNMPPDIDARLASLTLSDVDIGEFSSYRTGYTGVPGDGVTVTTIVAAATQPDAAVEPAPADEDGDPRNGHQVGTAGDPEITVTVTSPDGSRTRVYRVQIESAETSPVVPEWTLSDCLNGLTKGSLSYVVFGGGSIADLMDCFSGRGVAALWGNPDQTWIPLVFGAPRYVNLRFTDYYAEGIAPFTPFIAWRDLRERPVVRRRAPVQEANAQSSPGTSAGAEPAPALAPAPEAQQRQAVWRVVGYTGGDGVSHRNACADDARLSEIGGWADGTEVEVLEEGSGSCEGWLRVRSGEVTSWVREEYLVEAGGAEPEPAPEAQQQQAVRRVIGNTGGDGVSHRNACADDARLSEIGGWADGTEVEVLEEGSGSCEGWLRVRAGEVTSWVREEYVVEPGAASPAPAPGAGQQPAIWHRIGYTGGDGVSHRDVCADDARLSEIGGWADGTEVEVLEEGSGSCEGWLRVRAGGVTSWVREEYLVTTTMGIGPD